jgi:heme A synthase
MSMELFFGIEKFLSIIVTALAFGAFFFTLRHRRFYSCWARSAILLAAVVELYSSWNFDTTNAILIQIGHSLSISLFVFTIIRFKWSARREFKKINKELGKTKNNINRIKEEV